MWVQAADAMCGGAKAKGVLRCGLCVATSAVTLSEWGCGAKEMSSFCSA